MRNKEVYYKDSYVIKIEIYIAPKIQVRYLKKDCMSDKQWFKIIDARTLLFIF